MATGSDPGGVVWPHIRIVALVVIVALGVVPRTRRPSSSTRVECCRASTTQESVSTADPALGPGFNGSLALDPGGDVFVSHVGRVSRLDAGDGTETSEPATSGLAGFGGIGEDITRGLVVVEHCGPGGVEFNRSACARSEIDAARTSAS